MLTCNICKRTYKNVDAYNVHLNRRSHYRKVAQFDCFYSKFPDSDAYKEWLKIRAESDAPRLKEEKK